MMNYQKGDLVILDNEQMWHSDTLFTVVGGRNTNAYYQWYLLKHVYPPHPFGTEKFYINAEANNLWKVPLDEINDMIEQKQRVPIDVWNYILSFIIRKQDRRLLLANRF